MNQLYKERTFLRTLASHSKEEETLASGSWLVTMKLLNDESFSTSSSVAELRRAARHRGGALCVWLRNSCENHKGRGGRFPGHGAARTLTAGGHGRGRFTRTARGAGKS